jgi:ABC-2 type transport system ATP-binding protein
MRQNDPPPVIEVRGLVKRYRDSDRPAVDSLDMTVRGGEFVALLGPNGAGKTTTLSILTTSLNKTAGEVRVAGYDLDTHAKEIRARIGIIFQSPSLDLRLTAEENLRFHASLYGIYGYRPTFRLMPRAYRDQVLTLARLLGIEGDLCHRVEKFSGGMRRKLEIVRSLMHHPKVLFLDEPTQGLDPVSRQSLWSYLRQVQKEEGTTVFLTTHYIEEAEGADRVFIVAKGRLLTEGTPETLKVQIADRYLLLDAVDRDQLVRDLDGLTVTTGEDGLLKVAFDGATPQGLLARITVPLTVLRIHVPSLEEAYIELVGREEAETAAG